jgi:uncharacterized protein (TIGR02246 family)
MIVTACQPGVRPLSDEDLATIRDLTEREVVEALLAEDWDRFAAGFTVDAVRMPPNEPVQQGRETIRAWAETNLEPLTTTEFTQTAVDIDGRGDLAYARGSYSATLEAPGVPEPVTDGGKFLVILHKQEDGTWQVSVSIYNSDAPMPTMDAETSR